MSAKRKAGTCRIFLDFETTALGDARVIDIVQISATSAEGASFEQYVLPVPGRKMSPGASAVTGITLERLRGELCALDWKTVAAQFREWCAEQSQGRGLEVVAHNGTAFDFPLAVRALSSCGVLEGATLIDSLTAFRALRPGLESYALSNLYMQLIPEAEREALVWHDASADTRALAALWNVQGNTFAELAVGHGHSFEEVCVHARQLWRSTGPPPQCPSKACAVLGLCLWTRVSNSKRNPGRLYSTCKECNHFSWASPPTNGERSAEKAAPRLRPPRVQIAD